MGSDSRNARQPKRKDKSYQRIFPRQSQRLEAGCGSNSLKNRSSSRLKFLAPSTRYAVWVVSQETSLTHGDVTRGL